MFLNNYNDLLSKEDIFKAATAINTEITYFLSRSPHSIQPYNSFHHTEDGELLEYQVGEQKNALDQNEFVERQCRRYCQSWEEFLLKLVAKFVPAITQQRDENGLKNA